MEWPKGEEYIKISVGDLKEMKQAFGGCGDDKTVVGERRGYFRIVAQQDATSRLVGPELAEAGHWHYRIPVEYASGIRAGNDCLDFPAVACVIS